MELHEYYRHNKFNPTTFDISSDDKLRLHRIKRNNLYVNKLSIPNMIWKNLRVLEVGCSSGENSLLYAQMGAKLTLVEPLEDSVEKLKQLFIHFGIQDSVEQIFVDVVENVYLSGKYNIIVAEGFINSIKRKKEVIRKLFEGLATEGLLIISTADSIGSFIECFKSALAQLYCRKNNIETFDSKVEAVRPFFEEDFKKIPHSRAFELWVKDILINPIYTDYPLYDFDEIVEDLKDLNPFYYSSWPSYRHANDLTWHKKTVENGRALRQVVDGYNLRRMSFLLGEEMDEKEAMMFLVENENTDIIVKIKNIIFAIRSELHGKSENSLYNALKKAEEISNGKIKQLLREMIFVLKKMDPESYLTCGLLRKYWGVPCHYIVLTNK